MVRQEKSYAIYGYTDGDMPTLIRLIVILIFLGGLAFGGMVALTVSVEPGGTEFRVRTPSGDLVMTDDSGDPLTLRDHLPSPRVTEPDAPAGRPPLPAQSTPPAAPAANQPAPDMS